MTARPALLIANDNSRRGREIAPFIAALEAGGMTIRREQTATAEEIGRTIRALRDEVACVLLGGGDGTLHAAAAALHETRLPLGILPLGTANDLARSLGIAPGAEAAAAVILAGKLREIDLGTVNGIPFFNVASLGLSVAITQRLDGILKRRLGVLAYPFAAAVTILRRRRFTVLLRADETETVSRTLQVAVGNGRHYGGGMVVNEHATLDDATLHVYSLEPRAFWRLLFMARAFRSGQHEQLREVRTISCRTLAISTKRPHRITADGEMASQTPAEFAVLPRAVRVFAP